jgi:hypothetical protein
MPQGAISSEFMGFHLSLFEGLIELGYKGILGGRRVDEE